MNLAVPFLVGLVATASTACLAEFGLARLAGRRVRPRARNLAARSPAGFRRRDLVVRLRRAVGAVGRSDEMWPTWLEAAARSARTGASLRVALRDTADAFLSTTIGPQLLRFVRVLDGGGPLEAAVEQLHGGGAATGDGLVVRALTLAVRIGGPAAVVLDAMASTMRERAALVREVRALSTQARASAAVMIVSPVVFAVLAGGADQRVLTFLITAPGLLCVGAGLVLDLLGALWMARIVRAEP